MNRLSLERDYLYLTNYTLPEAGQQHRWPVRLNHCFQRILLDAIFQDCWYHYLDRSARLPAYRQLTIEQLQQAVTLAERMLAQPDIVFSLNQRSLRYRGKQQGKIT